MNMMSALSQSGVSVELIVVDDASTDATGAMVKSVDDQRVRYLRLPVNGGCVHRTSRSLPARAEP